MYRIAFAFLALGVACAYGGMIMPRRVIDLDGRIVGGEDTTIDQFPYQVSVRLFGSHTCGGSIYNSRVIVTAAHCIYSSLNPRYYSVQYGVTVIGGSNNVIVAERVAKNSNYNSTSVNNDVALIFLASDIPLSATAKPIDLATTAPAPGTPAVVSGWGTLVEEGASPSILQQVSVQIVNSSECKSQYAGINDITEAMLCAGVSEGGKDACQGDSGGPLVANGQLVGIVSWGVGCARPDFSGVYSNVAQLRNWIEANVN